MLIQLTELEARVVGVLLEKEKTTPDQYPLTLNSITTACNQKSNREPVMALNEGEVQRILDDLREKNLLFEVSGSGSRVQKYKHRFCNTEFNSLKFSEQQKAIICVLLLRGPQTPGELRTRTNRLAEFSNVNEVERVLESLSGQSSVNDTHDPDYKGLTETIVVKLEREPGKRESRYAHLFSGEPSANVEKNDYSSTSIPSTSVEHASSVDYESPAINSGEQGDRIIALEKEMVALKVELEAIKKVLDL